MAGIQEQARGRQAWLHLEEVSWRWGSSPAWRRRRSLCPKGDPRGTWAQGWGRQHQDHCTLSLSQGAWHPALPAGQAIRALPKRKLHCIWSPDNFRTGCFLPTGTQHSFPFYLFFDVTFVLTLMQSPRDKGPLCVTPSPIWPWHTPGRPQRCDLGLVFQGSMASEIANVLD